MAPIPELGEEVAGGLWGRAAPRQWEGSRGEDANLHYPLVLVTALMNDGPFRSFGSTH